MEYKSSWTTFFTSCKLYKSCCYFNCLIAHFQVSSKGCHRERLLGRRQQGHQGVRQVLVHAQVHDVQLNRHLVKQQQNYCLEEIVTLYRVLSVFSPNFLSSIVNKFNVKYFWTHFYFTQFIVIWLSGWEFIFYLVPKYFSSYSNKFMAFYLNLKIWNITLMY